VIPNDKAATLAGLTPARVSGTLEVPIGRIRKLVVGPRYLTAFTVGDQIMEGLMRHRGLSRAQARSRAIDMLRKVRIPAPEQRLEEFPHKLSGGMRQRVMIAMGLSCDPRLLIADEPTTALDVTIQAQILSLMRTLQQETGTAIVLITHDLGVVAEVADEVVVMYAGRIVERAPVKLLFDQPQHPYTVGLLGSIPRLAAPDGTRSEAVPRNVFSPFASQVTGGTQGAKGQNFGEPTTQNLPQNKQCVCFHYLIGLRLISGDTSFRRTSK
jgi:ABC-type dipeptide/oligopeptide/nickel transport system ATPase component